ncbi:actin-binding ADF family protein [Streptomyces rubradiris]|uniref:actin-binding ADF family protein n=1 Tax=Streptomyces rubradiris TaxID=285531 RepID=UPI001672F749|nr:actin depolymerization factor/cofilin-like domain-containing protein [Streptomyces rubradiris]
MSSGAAVNDRCVQEYQALKSEKKHRYVLFNLNADNTEIVVQKVSSSPEYDDFIADLPETECRWAVYDFEFEKEGAGERSKLVFVSWLPDTAKVKQKMLFTASKEELRRSLVGIAVEVDCSDSSEVAYDSLLDKVKRGH